MAPFEEWGKFGQSEEKGRHSLFSLPKQLTACDRQERGEIKIDPTAKLPEHEGALTIVHRSPQSKPAPRQAAGLSFNCWNISSMAESGIAMWSTGDSYVRRGLQRAAETLGSNLSTPGVRVCWFGWGGLQWRGLFSFFSHSLRGTAAPDVLIIHCGGSDMRKVSSVKLVSMMKEDLHQLHLQHPGIKIIFSSLAQRCRWEAGGNPAKIDKARKCVYS